MLTLAVSKTGTAEHSYTSVSSIPGEKLKPKEGLVA